MITFPSQLEGLSKKERAAVLSIKKLLIAAVVKHGSTNEHAREILEHVDDQWQHKLAKELHVLSGCTKPAPRVRRERAGWLWSCVCVCVCV